MINYSSKPIIIFIIIFLSKILLAIYLPLLNDEAYAISVSKEFSKSFFDHPPIGFWSSQIFVGIFGLESKFFFRLPFLIYGLFTTLFLFELGKHQVASSIFTWSIFFSNHSVVTSCFIICSFQSIFDDILLLYNNFFPYE